MGDSEPFSYEKSLCQDLVQPFSQKSRTPTVAEEYPIGLYDPAEADLELFCNSWSAGFLGERLYRHFLGCILQQEHGSAPAEKERTPDPARLS